MPVQGVDVWELGITENCMITLLTEKPFVADIPEEFVLLAETVTSVASAKYVTVAK
tara:strand:+ start:662 stop:829 length:168 start_codon:yes stop_codon:yes gene_type:complete